jgi:hypothetical protein
MKHLPKKTIGVFLLLTAAAVCFGGTLVVGRGGKYRTIQDAIEAAEAGDVIVIKSGTYTQDDSISISGKSDLEIKGEGNVTVACSQYVPVFYLSESEEITITNIHGVHKVKDPAVGKGECGPGATIITAKSCTGVYIRKCELNGCGQTGFEGISSNQIVLEGNYIHDNVNSAVALSWPEGDAEPDVRLEGNRFENNFGPVIVAEREGLFSMYFKDTDEAEGIVFSKNKWKNNDKMPKKTTVLNGMKIVFWGSPDSYEDEEGNPIVTSGVLDKDTGIAVGDGLFEFMGRSLVEFYENGLVSAGFGSGNNSLTLEDGTDVDLPAGGRLEFWETGVLKSAELEDGTLVEFDEQGAQLTNPDGDDGQGDDIEIDE